MNFVVCDLYQYSFFKEHRRWNSETPHHSGVNLFLTPSAVFGRLRKVERLGPFSMWEKLARIWQDERGLNPTEVYEKVRRFFCKCISD